MEKALWNMQMDVSMRECGRKTWGMVRVLNVILMVILIMVISRWEKQMVRESIPGLMVRYMMVNGFKALNKVMVFGEDCIMIVILENGKNRKLMGMVYTLGKMETDTKANGLTAWNTVRALISFQTVTRTQENIRMENQKEKANILGKTEQRMLENSNQAWSTVKASGVVEKKINAITTKVNTIMTRSAALGLSLGHLGTFIKESIKTMKGKATVRCTGLMSLAIKANGLKAFSMATDEWFSLMVRKKKATLKTMSTK
jgi:hypothetical protein